MLPLDSKPVSGTYVKLVFRATKYTGCDALAFRDAVNRKLRESKYFYVVNPAVTVRSTSTTLTDSERDEYFTDALVIMGITYPDTPTYGVIFDDYSNFIAGAWSCWGTNGAIRLVDANKSTYEVAQAVADSGKAVENANANRPEEAPDKVLSLLTVGAFAVIAVAGAYALAQVSVFFPKRKG